MAFLKSLGMERVADDPAEYDLRDLSSPQVFLLSMLVFLAIAGFVAAILYRQISHAFQTNPGLNGLIVGVLMVGILLAFIQVIRLFREQFVPSEVLALPIRQAQLATTVPASRFANSSNFLRT